MIGRPQSSTRTDPPFPNTTLFGSMWSGVRLIGQATLDDTADDRRHLCRFGDGIVGSRALKARLGKGALHGPDDVAALTHAAKRIVHAFGKLPAPRFDLVEIGRAHV